MTDIASLPHTTAFYEILNVNLYSTFPYIVIRSNVMDTLVLRQ